MREIKFKVWDTYKKIMDYTNLNIILQFGDYVGCNTEDGELIFMQYTGLKDKNGKEIYEGDTVHAWGGEYYLGAWEFAKTIDIKNLICDVYELSHYENLEVIGNIYENPDLLEEQ